MSHPFERRFDCGDEGQSEARPGEIRSARSVRIDCGTRIEFSPTRTPGTPSEALFVRGEGGSTDVVGHGEPRDGGGPREARAGGDQGGEQPGQLAAAEEVLPRARALQPPQRLAVPRVRPATRFHTAAAAWSCPLRRAPTRSPRVHLARERRANPARSSSRASTVNPTPSVARLTTPRASPAPLPRRQPAQSVRVQLGGALPGVLRQGQGGGPERGGAPRSIRGRRVRVRRTARSTVAAVSERSRRGCVSASLPRGQTNSRQLGVVPDSPSRACRRAR